MSIAAILWDYDGTLANSIPKNLVVTKAVLTQINPDFAHKKLPPALQSAQNYHQAMQETPNWRTLYTDNFGLSTTELKQAIALWGELQEQIETTVNLFTGMPQLIANLGHIPQGICSQNCSTAIRNVLAPLDLTKYFTTIVGYKDATGLKPKPHAARFLYCLEQLKISAGTVLYIGDHQEDVMFVTNANQLLTKANNHKIKILSVAACYSDARPQYWELQPDFHANSLQDIENLIFGHKIRGKNSSY